MKTIALSIFLLTSVAYADETKNCSNAEGSLRYEFRNAGAGASMGTSTEAVYVNGQKVIAASSAFRLESNIAKLHQGAKDTIVTVELMTVTMPTETRSDYVICRDIHKLTP